MLLYTAVKENPISRQFSESKKENNATAKKAITHFFFMLSVLIFNRDSCISQETT